MATVDNFFALVSLFGLAIVFVVGGILWINIDVPEIFNDNPTAQSVSNTADGFYNNLDSVFVIVFFSLHLGILITVFLLRSFPIIYPVGLLLIITLVLVSVPLSNSFEAFFDSDATTDVRANFAATDFIMEQLPLLSMIFGFITLIILGGMARTEGLI